MQTVSVVGLVEIIEQTGEDKPLGKRVTDIYLKGKDVVLDVQEVGENISNIVISVPVHDLMQALTNAMMHEHR